MWLCWRMPEELASSQMMSSFRHDWMESSDHSILINRPDTSWSLSLCPLLYDSQPWMRNQLPDFSFCCTATDSERRWLRRSIRDRPEESPLMDETSSHLQSFLTTPVSFLSHARSTLLLTYSNSHVAHCACGQWATKRLSEMKTNTGLSELNPQSDLERTGYHTEIKELQNILG